MRILLFILLAPCKILTAQTVWEFSQQARQLTSSYQFTEAMELLFKGLHQHPDDPQLRVQLGILLVRIGDNAPGEQALERELQRQPINLEILENLAEALLRQGKTSAAATLYRVV